MKHRIALFALLAGLALPALADRYNMPQHPAYIEECGSCHLAYPPQLLPAASWRALMNGLSNHFGSDASLDDKRRGAIADFLAAHSGRAGARDGRPLLRISESAHFLKEHREIPAATWRRASIKSQANCAVCHRDAAAGDFGERSIAIPQ